MTKDRTSNVARADSDGASTMDLSGRSVGSSYVLHHPIGHGATGTVWRGLDRTTGEPVAVKLLHESLLRQHRLIARFVQEHKILLMLRHRNVVRVRELVSVGQTLGLVMDLVDGGSLRDHLRAYGPVAAGEACRLAAQVAAALAEAHELGVIHRDLKPDNILLRVEGGRLDTRLTDFGVARDLNTASMTTPNAVVGTPHYLAPEAFHGVKATAALDVYALGALLFELVSGRPPYDSDSIPDLMRQHMEGNPVRRPGIPDEVWELIEDCMAGKPRLRPTAADLVVALSEAARTCARTPPLPRPPGDYVDPGSAYADESAFYPSGWSGVAPRQPGPVHSHAGAEAPERPSADPRGNAAPNWRWAKRPGAAVTLIVGAVLAAAVAGTPWNFGRAREQPRTEGQPRIEVLPRIAVPAPMRVAPSPSGKPSPSPAKSRNQRRESPGGGAGRRAEPGSAAVRSGTAGSVPAKAPAPRVTETRSPQPEAAAYGPWQCTQQFAFDVRSRTPLAPHPCQMLGDDVRYQATLTAPGGGTGSITVALQDVASGRMVAGPKTCANLVFDGETATRGCGPAAATPSRGRRYSVVMTYQYEREGRLVASSSRGSVFSW